MKQDLRTGRWSSTPLLDRFFNSLDIDRKSKCWNWVKSCVGALRDRPAIKAGSPLRQTRASHVALIYIKGLPRPSDKHQACHTCDNTKCVNPDHLWWGTGKENMRDASRKGRMNSPSPEHIENIKKALAVRWANKDYRAEHSKRLALANKTKGHW